MSRKSNARKQLLKVYGPTYKGWKIHNPRCFYCSEYGSELDHVPSLDQVDILLRVPRYMIRACSECNNLLGSVGYSIHSRLLHLEKKYTAKLERGMALWSKEEVRELGYSLRVVVAHKVKMQDILIDKIRGVQHRLCNPESWPSQSFRLVPYPVAPP